MTPRTERSELSQTLTELITLRENETEIQQRIDTLAEAIRNKNLDQVMSHYAPDVIVFDLMPPLDVRGIAAYRRNFERWFA
jgi:ketosteroid isomerase-like protein